MAIAAIIFQRVIVPIIFTLCKYSFYARFELEILADIHTYQFSCVDDSMNDAMIATDLFDLQVYCFGQ